MRPSSSQLAEFITMSASPLLHQHRHIISSSFLIKEDLREGTKLRVGWNGGSSGASPAKGRHHGGGIHLLWNNQGMFILQIIPVFFSSPTILGLCLGIFTSATISLSMQDLKALRPQLYSAAEYFELAYTQEGGKQAYVIYPLLPPACSTISFRCS